MEIIQECAKNFKTLIDNKTQYVYHISLKQKVKVFTIDFQDTDFKHAIGLHHLADLYVPKQAAKTISWILDEKKPITDEYLSKSVFYKGSSYDEKDIELRISEAVYLEEYLDINNIVYIYSPKDFPRNNSIITCDYIIKSYIKERDKTVYIFIKHRNGEGSPCVVKTFCVEKTTPYGGIYSFIMLKDKVVNGVRSRLFRHKKYTDEQIEAIEPNIIISVDNDKEPNALGKNV